MTVRGKFPRWRTKQLIFYPGPGVFVQHHQWQHGWGMLRGGLPWWWSMVDGGYGCWWMIGKWPFFPVGIWGFSQNFGACVVLQAANGWGKAVLDILAHSLEGRSLEYFRCRYFVGISSAMLGGRSRPMMVGCKPGGLQNPFFRSHPLWSRSCN